MEKKSQKHSSCCCLLKRDETMDEKEAAGPSRENANPWPHLARLFQFPEFSEIFNIVKEHGKKMKMTFLLSIPFTFSKVLTLTFFTTPGHFCS